MTAHDLLFFSKPPEDRFKNIPNDSNVTGRPNHQDVGSWAGQGAAGHPEHHPFDLGQEGSVQANASAARRGDAQKSVRFSLFLISGNIANRRFESSFGPPRRA